MERGHDVLRWVRLAGMAFVLVVGWMFVAWQNRFHVTAPVVFACLAYFAVVMVVWNLWRTGATAVSADQYGEEAWVRPVGARDELEKEKRGLLKAIKEAEFDREMGKLSAADADAMIKAYKDRAKEVLKALGGYERTAASVREKIEREVKARIEIEAAATKGKKKKQQGVAS